MINHMARKQVLVQLDDELVAALDDLATAEGVSRSELIRRAAQAILQADEIRRKEAQHAAGYEQIPEDTTLAEALLHVSVSTWDPYEEG